MGRGEGTNDFQPPSQSPALPEKLERFREMVEMLWQRLAEFLSMGARSVVGWRRGGRTPGVGCSAAVELVGGISGGFQLVPKSLGQPDDEAEG